MKCNKCGYDDGDSGDMAHVCQRPSYRYGEHPTSFGLVKPVQELKCNPHPKAPHGFNRNASHANDRYTCECEGWDAYDAGYQAGVMAGIEASMGQEPEQEPDEVDIRSRLYQRIHELETQLEQPKEPDSMRVYVENFATKVGWVKGSMEGAFEYIQRKSYAQGLEDATPPQRKPLTDEQIDAIASSVRKADTPESVLIRLSRAIEAAHGIKE